MTKCPNLKIVWTFLNPSVHISWCICGIADYFCMLCESFSNPKHMILSVNMMKRPHHILPSECLYAHEAFGCIDRTIFPRRVSWFHLFRLSQYCISKSSSSFSMQRHSGHTHMAGNTLSFPTVLFLLFLIFAEYFKSLPNSGTLRKKERITETQGNSNNNIGINPNTFCIDHVWWTKWMWTKQNTKRMNIYIATSWNCLFSRRNS